MPTSRTTQRLSKPIGDDRVPPPTFSYFRTRRRMKAFTAVHRELERSGITKTCLAKRMGKGIDRVSHLLAAPSNWTSDTESDLLFAISGAEVNYDPLSYPLDLPVRNRRKPEWLDEAGGAKQRISTTGTSATVYLIASGSTSTVTTATPSAKVGWKIA